MRKKNKNRKSDVEINETAVEEAEEKTEILDEEDEVVEEPAEATEEIEEEPTEEAPEEPAERAVEEPEEAAEEPVENAADKSAEEAAEQAGEADNKAAIDGSIPAAAEAPERKDAAPAASIFFFIVGIIFLIVSAFMLITAISYTKTYLSSYEASFADMWSNSLQYVIGQFVPYLGFGIVSLGLGKAIGEFAAGRLSADQIRQMVEERERAKAGDAVAEAKAAAAAEPVAAKSAAAEDPAEAGGDIGFQVFELLKEIEALREVMNIKFEETEKRQAYRLEDNRKILADELAEYKNMRAGRDDTLIAEIAKISDYFGMNEDELEDDGFDPCVEKRERRFIK